VKVIVDTAVWSLALRRTDPNEDVGRELISLVEEQRVVLLGPIRQEILSGYSDATQFELLRSKLSYFDNDPILDEDYVRAAQYHNSCRRRGIQGSHTDYLVCSCAFRLQALIYTRDNDFRHYARVLPISLYEERG